MQQLQEEPRYDAETLRRATALAQELQADRDEKLSARDIEAIGAEVGVAPELMREALAQLSALPEAQAELPEVAEIRARNFANGWWAGGWTLPIILATTLQAWPDVVGGFFMAGWGVYLCGGMWALSRAEEWKKRRELKEKAEQEAAASRAQYFSALRAAAHRGEAETFLSVACVGREMTGALRQWVAATARAYGGDLRITGEELTCVFPNVDLAMRVAYALQTDVAPGVQIRCGVASVNPARACHFQRVAAAGDIVAGPEVAPAALDVLGRMAALDQLVDGERAFSWRRGG